jgi:hypothetical protein
MKTISGSVLLASLCSVVLASKDSTIYPNGFTNPNVNKPMYWQDSQNVLQDLSQFDKLYVQYHGCTWSSYFEASGGDGDNICSGADEGEGGDDDGWYLGQAGCSRAQVAYSLYGTLKGNRDKGCRKSQFINSFFTFGGVEAWISSMQSVGHLQDFTTSNGNNNEDRRLGYDEYTISSTCTAAGGDNRNLDEEDGNNGNSGATSIGVGCTTAGNFRLYEFQGSYCHADSSAQTVDSLSAFNSAIEDQKCVQIYDGSSYTYNGGDDDQYSATPLNVLAQSKSCSLQWSTDCPDPHGKVSQYEIAMYRSLMNGEAKDFKIVTIFFFVAGTLLLLLAGFFMKSSQQKKQSCVHVEDTKSVKSTTTDPDDESEQPRAFLPSLANFGMRPFQQRETSAAHVEDTTPDVEENASEAAQRERPVLRLRTELEEPQPVSVGNEVAYVKRRREVATEDAYVKMPNEDADVEVPGEAHSQPESQPPKQSVSKTAPTRTAPTRTQSKGKGLRGLFSKILK